ncbi:MAG: hypothetical protein ACKV2T_42760, partial [Kofleriaceae bacterium]
TVGAFSGEFGVSVGTLGDTWERDENGMWRVLDIELAPPHRFARAVEDVRGGVLLFGGEQYLGTATYWNDTWRFGYGPDSNACASGIDVGRGAGCADPGCWHLCSPTCAPGQACPMSEPQCGNLVRDPLETCRTCPGDVGACTLADAVCGDTICDPGEATTCPGDC